MQYMNRAFPYDPALLGVPISGRNLRIWMEQRLPEVGIGDQPEPDVYVESTTTCYERGCCETRREHIVVNTIWHHGLRKDSLYDLIGLHMGQFDPHMNQ